MLSPEFLQPIFDRVATHFLSMTHPSSAPDKSMCYYRDENTGERCFIGALIQDKDYIPTIEGLSIRSHHTGYRPVGTRGMLEVAVVRGLNALGIEIDDLNDDIRDTLDELQVIHDGWGEAKYGRESVTRRLIEFAEAFKLSTAALTAEVVS
ncbi:hypothetical protein UFOVP1202_47 [uncultured Caudovirales phage]|uniref:Uncharacterized protein n=1 Tax=uncultured Caudovirales phage TaxID=2100421 RepID=A0A6J5R7I6_9CAUD|nr:hypothetical protein UFOVP1202_47 [uncultured Caudovirales phage]